MAHLALLIAIGNGSTFRDPIALKSLIKPWSYLVKVSLIDVHAADIQPHSKAIVEPEQLTEALPLNLWIVRASRGSSLVIEALTA